VQRSHEPVLGAIAETALENGADRRLKYIVNKCKPSDRPGVLFDIMKETHVTEELEISNCLPVFKKWGVYTSSVSIKQDALRSRSYVLWRNPNLAFRAVFGANARAEILFALSHTTRAYISQLAKRIGLSYQPVHAEVEHLILNGLVEFEYIGKAKLVSLSPRAAEFVRLLPVG
jgi:hypothetical protein